MKGGLYFWIQGINVQMNHCINEGFLVVVLTNNNTNLVLS